MWGTFLSEPLDIVALVGRYPANQLMSRMAILRRRSFTPEPHAGSGKHGVLIRLSAGYPPAEGRFHTRYSPVRHSCTPEGALPFDLHVLGLPLAFILSQDQTLRCKYVLDLKSVSAPIAPKDYPRLRQNDALENYSKVILNHL